MCFLVLVRCPKCNSSLRYPRHCSFGVEDVREDDNDSSQGPTCKATGELLTVCLDTATCDDCLRYLHAERKRRAISKNGDGANDKDRGNKLLLEFWHAEASKRRSQSKSPKPVNGSVK